MKSMIRRSLKITGLAVAAFLSVKILCFSNPVEMVIGWIALAYMAMVIICTAIHWGKEK